MKVNQFKEAVSHMPVNDMLRDRFIFGFLWGVQVGILIMIIAGIIDSWTS